MSRVGIWNPQVQPGAQGRQQTTASGIPMRNLGGSPMMVPGSGMMMPGLGQPGREINPMGRFEGILSQGLGGMGVGGGGALGAPAGQGGGMFGDMTSLEKMFLLTSGVGAAADIGSSIYDRVKESRREKREEERRDMAGRKLSDALDRPYRS